MRLSETFSAVTTLLYCPSLLAWFLKCVRKIQSVKLRELNGLCGPLESSINLWRRSKTIRQTDRSIANRLAQNLL